LFGMIKVLVAAGTKLYNPRWTMVDLGRWLPPLQDLPLIHFTSFLLLTGRRRGDSSLESVYDVRGKSAMVAVGDICDR
jgi:hypothetical protein